MKRIRDLTILLGLIGALLLLAQEVKPNKVEVIDLGRGVKLEIVLLPARKIVMGKYFWTLARSSLSLVKRRLRNHFKWESMK